MVNYYDILLLEMMNNAIDEADEADDETTSSDLADDENEEDYEIVYMTDFNKV